jgi:hypothetical protein
MMKMQTRAKRRKTSETTTPQAAQRLSKGLRIREAAGVGNFRPRPQHFRAKHAVIELLAGNQPVNHSSIAKSLGISRQALYKFRRAYPGFDAWLTEELRKECAHLAAAVVHKMAMLALRGSVKHAETFLRAIEYGGFGRQASGLRDANGQLEELRVHLMDGPNDTVGRVDAIRLGWPGMPGGGRAH